MYSGNTEKVDNFRMESVANLDRNGWTTSNGTGGQLQMEWVDSLPRRTHVRIRTSGRRIKTRTKQPFPAFLTIRHPQGEEGVKIADLSGQMRLAPFLELSDRARQCIERIPNALLRSFDRRGIPLYPQVF